MRRVGKLHGGEPALRPRDAMTTLRTCAGWGWKLRSFYGQAYCSQRCVAAEGMAQILAELHRFAA